MKKNPTSRSGFFGSRAFFGLAMILTGMALALVGFGSSAYETARPAIAPYQFVADSPMTFTVTNTNDSGTGSLRQAITDANGTGGGTINFNIPGRGVHTISPALAWQVIRRRSGNVACANIVPVARKPSRK